MNLKTFGKEMLGALLRTSPAFKTSSQRSIKATATPTRKGRPQLAALMIGTLSVIVTVALILLASWKATEVDFLGWAAPGVLAQANKLTSSKDYFSRLANLLAQWREKRRIEQDTTTARLDEDLSEMYRGCLALLANQNENLLDRNKAWLKDRCQTWVDLVHEQRVALAERKDTKSARNSMIKMVTEMIDELQTKAAEEQQG